MIELKQLCRSFMLGDQAVHALDKVNLTIAAGEYLSVMGPSGSGKSTLLNVLGLLDVPSSGQYLLNDTDTTSLSETERARYRREHIGFVFQSYHLVARLSARENIELPLVLAGIAPATRRKKVDTILDQLGLAERAAHLPNQLSGGQRQRVAIGRAMIMQPGLLLADEPTGNLDTQSGNDVVAILEQLNQQGITLLVVTHDTALGKRAKRRIRMVDGAIVDDDHNPPAQSAPEQDKATPENTAPADPAASGAD
jgi:putative ABC transport system ATP-binding protein